MAQMLAKHSIEWTIIFYLTSWLSVTFLVIYYDCCCVGIVPNFALFYGQVFFPETFNISNGVRQGVLSPFLCALYIDDLTYQVNVGCYVDCHVLNHLLFADDAVIFAPSAKGLQQLLDIQDGPKNETTLVRPPAATVQDKKPSCRATRACQLKSCKLLRCTNVDDLHLNSPETDE